MDFKTREAPELHSFINERNGLKELKLLAGKFKDPTNPTIAARAWAYFIVYGSSLIGKAIPAVAIQSRLLSVILKGLKAAIDWKAKRIGVQQKDI